MNEESVGFLRRMKLNPVFIVLTILAVGVFVQEISQLERITDFNLFLKNNGVTKLEKKEVPQSNLPKFDVVTFNPTVTMPYVVKVSALDYFLNYSVAKPNKQYADTALFFHK